MQNVKNDSFSSDFSFNDDINIKNLEFSYDKKKIIKKLNLKIFNKKITAVVGPTGSGKSTLINLLLKFYSPSSGIISVGKTDLQKISNNSWRKGISTIHQSPYIFNASILDNISMFDKSIDIKDIKRVSKNIGISEFINKLPKKYDSIIGGREIELSGGQKQKIQIARALVRKPKLLILDEATSSQDSISEDIIMKSIKRFFPNVTILIISHRFSSLKKAEYIYCINDGKLVEEGTWYSFNKKKSGLFKKNVKFTNNKINQKLIDEIYYNYRLCRFYWKQITKENNQRWLLCYWDRQFFFSGKRKNINIFNKCKNFLFLSKTYKITKK